MTNLTIAKRKLRELIRSEKMKRFGPNIQLYHELSLKMTENVISLDGFKKAGVIGLFASKQISYEIETDALINYALSHDKRVYLPRCIVDSKDLEFCEIGNLVKDMEIGAYQLREPIKEIKPLKISELASVLDILFVPGVAFDINTGNRLGFGSGYYDKFISKIKKINKALPVWALAFDFQLNPFGFIKNNSDDANLLQTDLKSKERDLLMRFPADERDSSVDLIITPSKIIEITKME